MEQTDSELQPMSPADITDSDSTGQHMSLPVTDPLSDDGSREAEQTASADMASLSPSIDLHRQGAPDSVDKHSTSDDETEDETGKVPSDTPEQEEGDNKQQAQENIASKVKKDSNPPEDQSVILCDIRDSVASLGDLQESVGKGFKHLIEEARQTNCLLSQLIEHLKTQAVKTSEQSEQIAKIKLMKEPTMFSQSYDNERDNFSQLSDLSTYKGLYQINPKSCDDKGKLSVLEHKLDPTKERKESHGSVPEFDCIFNPFDRPLPHEPLLYSSAPHALPEQAPERPMFGLDSMEPASPLLEQGSVGKAPRPDTGSGALGNTERPPVMGPGNAHEATRRVWESRYPVPHQPASVGLESSDGKKQPAQKQHGYASGGQSSSAMKQTDRKNTDGKELFTEGLDAPVEKKANRFSAPNRSSGKPENSGQKSGEIQDVRPKEIPVYTSGQSQQRGRGDDTSTRAPQEQAKSRARARFSAMGLSIESGSESETTRLMEALERAREPDPDPAPKAKSFDTVLCLDISQSMWDGGAYKQMMHCVNEFLDGIEDIVNDSGVEENIGLVTFGGRANVEQHLTNDFTRVRDAIERFAVGGKSPFFEAMVVCLAAFDGKGGTVSVSGEYDVSPRIIFITDGHITECSDDPDGPDRVADATNTRARFSRLMMDLDPHSHSGMPHPIIFVPVGHRADRTFLEAMATLNKSPLVEPQNIRSLCNYFRVQETIGKVIVTLKNKEDGGTENQIRAVVQALVPELEQSGDMREVVETVQRELNEPGRKKKRDSKPTDFDNVFEDKDGVMRGDRLLLGTRVLRGPDWMWGNQDSSGPGTVIQHDDKKHPFTWVMWDSGEWNRYAYGPEMGFHIWKAEDTPRLKLLDGDLQIGMTVKKGTKWDCGDPKYGIGRGIIIRKSKDGKQLKVRWENGEIQACNMDSVTYSDPFESAQRDQTLSEELFGHRLDQEHEGRLNEEEETGDGVRVWQWKDDWGNWRLYPPHHNDALERAYTKRKDGSCIVQRDGNNFRVHFRRMSEKAIDTHVEREVKRKFLSVDEYESLTKAEEVMSQ